MKAGIAGFGVWARGLEGVAAFEEHQQNNFAGMPESDFANPKPQSVPPKERRRAGLMINLAVEVAHQACDDAAIDKSQIPSVFVSALGDTAITDYMCRKLAQPEKLLSPTKFHNSVHNAPSGYWTISAENRAPSSFVGGFRESFGAGLLEAVSQAHAFAAPVLLVAYDIANNAPFKDIEPVSESMGIGLVVTNGESGGANCPQGSQNTVVFDVDFEARKGDAGEATHSLSQPLSEPLRNFACANPVGAGFALLEQVVLKRRGADLMHIASVQELRLAAAPSAVLRISF